MTRRLRFFLLLTSLLWPLLAGASEVIWIPGSGGGGGGPYSFTFVGSVYGTDDTNDDTISTATTSISVQAGDLIIAAVQWEDDATAEVSTIVDDGSFNAVDTKYTEVHNGAGTTPPNAMNLHVWWGIADTPRTVTRFDTVLSANLPYKKMTVVVYRPSGGTVALDISGTPNNADDTNLDGAPTTGSFTTSGSNDVVCAMAGIYTGGGTWTSAVIGGTAADSIEGNSGQVIWCLDDTTSLSSVTAGIDYGVTRYWAATAIAFRAE